MIIGKNLFQKPKNDLEVYPKQYSKFSPSVPDEMWISCPSCKTALLSGDLNDNMHVCPKCGYHFHLNARQRISIICDEDTFSEINGGIKSTNIIDFPQYNKKLKHAMLESAESEAVITGTAQIGGHKCALFVMDPFFMVGSMGTVVGEKITCLFEYATKNSLPVIGYTVSGGARMQEGILSLMQMAKTSAAVKRHSNAGNLYITVLTDPTTGGVTASFAMEGDIIIAEPNALIGFAGPRVIEQTIRQKLPQGFQRSEFLLQKGFIDTIIARKDHKKFLKRLLTLHAS